MARRYLKFGIEDTFGDGYSSGEDTSMPMTSVSLEIDRQPLYEESIETYNPINVFGGGLSVSGSVEGTLRPRSMVDILEALCGKREDVGDNAVFTLDYPKSLEFNIGEKVINESTETKLVGVIASELNITAESGEIVTFTLDYIAKEPSQTSFDNSFEVEKTRPVVFYGASVQIDNGGGYQNLKVQSFNTTLNRSIDDDYYVLDSATLDGIQLDGHAEFNGELTFTEREFEEMKRMIYGDDVNTFPANNDLQVSKLKFVGKDVDGDDCIEIEFPAAVWISGERTISGQDPVEKTLSFRLVENDADEFKITVYDVNATEGGEE